MEPFFSPALYKQRHEFVVEFVRRNKPKKVVDLGCNDCTLLRMLKFHREIQVLSGVDINSAIMKKKMHGLDPIPTDYLQPGFSPLSIELYQGSVTQKDARLRGFDLVTSMELIEHLHLDDVDRFSEVVFNYMTPVSVIISTPNSEFNPLFPRLAGFRHFDHKFEWTRAEFQSWALKVCVKYGYEVQFTGVGQAPAGQQDRVGFCSQIGVFWRLGGRDNLCMLPSDDADEMFSYTLLYSVAYPSLCDSNILQRTLVTEVLYWAERLRREWVEGRAEGDTASAPWQTGGAEMRDPIEPCGRGALDDEGREHREEEEEFGTGGRQQQESYRQTRRVCVPLARLWSACPRVKALSGSLCHLRRLLLDQPLVRLTQDGSAVLLDDQEQDQEDEDDMEDTGCTEACRCSCIAVEEEEDWEADL
ncbi:small RNA 2'-O-methyltransferase [Polymixia lowei]